MNWKSASSKAINSVTGVVKSSVQSTQSTQDNETAYADLVCPSCGQKTPVTECAMLSPKETHTEACKNCRKSISMKYTTDPVEWEVFTN